MSWYFFSTGHKLSFPGHFLNIKRKLYCLRHLLWRDRHCWRRPLSIPCHQDDGCRSFLLGKSPETQPVVVSSGRLIPLWQVSICHFVFWASPVVFNCLVWVWVFFVYEFGFRFYGVDFCSVIRYLALTNARKIYLHDIHVSKDNQDDWFSFYVL